MSINALLVLSVLQDLLIDNQRLKYYNQGEEEEELKHYNVLSCLREIKTARRTKRWLRKRHNFLKVGQNSEKDQEKGWYRIRRTTFKR